MKLKELKRTVNVCWSPAEHYPVTIAAGTAAQQVDASFSSSSYLELYYLNLEDPGSDLELKSSFQTQHKFQKIVWSGSEIIVGGCDGGLLEFYSSDKLLNNASDCLLGSSTKHSGNVSSLDINPYQKNLLASGASESEIFIWDLNNTSQPMAPGNKSQPYDHVQGLAWNQQVQHILGSTFATRCVVWDLRKNEPIMKLSDSQSRTRWRSLAWHPSVATQVCIASEDDQMPVIQLWDLRLAASPLLTLEGHHKGVMSLSWCKQDPDLLLSSGKDGRVLCWNPNNTQPGGALLAEVSRSAGWVYEVSWCARDPALLASASFEQLLHVSSLLGGSRPETSSQSASNILESFGGAAFTQLPAVARAPAPEETRAAQLPIAPRWLRRPRAARFAFGGKLVTFDRCPQEAGTPKQVIISQVVSEPELVQKAADLDAVIGAVLSDEPGAPDQLAEYCRSRGDAASDQDERYTWFFLRASFLPTFRTEVLNLLGFKQDEIPSKFKSPPSDAITQADPAGLSRGESTETEAELSTDTSTDLSDAHTLIERKLANLDIEPDVSNIVIPNGEDSTSLICRALVCGNLEEAVELCLDAERIADALIIASLGSPELVVRVQLFHLRRAAADPVALLGGTLLRARWAALCAAAAPAAWRHVLAALVTHCPPDELAEHCEALGNRLAAEATSEPALAQAADTCYLVGMSADALASRWHRGGDVGALLDSTARALLARRAAERRGRPVRPGGRLDAVLLEYAGRLAAQGCLRAALLALQGVATSDLTERLANALGERSQPQQQQQQQQPAGARARTVSGHSHKYNNYTHGNAEARYEQPWVAPQEPAWQPPAHPPRPGSVGPQAGITSRSKYKVDPSVQPAPSHYNQYGFNQPNPMTSQPRGYGYNSPLPDQYQNSSVPNTFAPINPVNPGLNPLNPLNPVNPGLNPVNPGLNPLNPVNPGLNPGLTPLNPGLNPMNPGLNPLNPVNPGLNPANPVNPVVNGSYYNPQPVEQAMQAAPVQNKPIQAGWNDPPMLSSNKSKPKQEVQSQAPITHPLFGVEPQHVPLAAPGQYQAQQYPGQQQQQPQQQYPGQQYPAQQYPAQQYPGQYDQQYQQQYQPVQQGYQPQPETAAPKPPVPEQHAVLQTVLDALREDCARRAHNPQMKRKLDDVQRRLETLYDMLRENKLSEPALEALHSCAQLAAEGQAARALGAATALAAGADFAAAAAFLPGLKVLFQLAAQLQPAS